MSITIEAQATRTLIQQDGVSRVAINDDGSMEILTPPSIPSGNMVTTFNQFGNSLSANGYQKLPSGLIIQWGTYTAGVTSVIFPISFPTACRSVVMSNNSDGVSNVPGIYGYTVSGFTSNSTSYTIAYMAIGY